jgi:hypothetical protein
MPAVKISARLKLDETISFLDGHYQMIRIDDDARRLRVAPITRYFVLALSVSRFQI